jgi:hypothetical protein
MLRKEKRWSILCVSFASRLPEEIGHVKGSKRSLIYNWYSWQVPLQGESYTLRYYEEKYVYPTVRFSLFGFWKGITFFFIYFCEI